MRSSVQKLAAAALVLVFPAQMLLPLSADGCTIFFGSNGMGGYAAECRGGCDNQGFCGTESVQHGSYTIYFCSCDGDKVTGCSGDVGIDNGAFPGPLMWWVCQGPCPELESCKEQDYRGSPVVEACKCE